MTTRERLDRWYRDGLLTSEEHAAVSAVAQKTRFSVYLELNALLYVGVVALATGLAWTMRSWFTDIGDVAVVLTLSATLAGCAYYVATRARPYSPTLVESPGLAFDYVLYLGCLVIGLELTYLQVRFQLLGGAWDLLVLGSAVVFFTLAYRFDNRFVLSLAFSTLATWFGIKLSVLGIAPETSLRPAALGYGAVIGASGLALYQRGVKPHFLETHLHLAVNVILAALLSGTWEPGIGWAYLLALFSASSAVIWFGSRQRRFAFAAYGVVYAYVGITSRLVGMMPGSIFTFAYFVVSGIAVLAFLVTLSRRFGRST